MPKPQPSTQATARWAKTMGWRLGLVQILANLVGVVIVVTYFMALEPASVSGRGGSLQVAIWLTSFLMVIGFGFIFWWERALIQAFKKLGAGQTLSPEFLVRAQRKVMQAPVAYGGVSMFNWCLAAVVMSVNTWFYGVSAGPGDTLGFATVRVFCGILIAGVAAASIVYFKTTELFKVLRPALFPDGGLVEMTGVPRVGVRARLLYVLLLASLVPVMVTAYVVYQKAVFTASAGPQAMLASLAWLLAFLLAASLVLVLVLARLLARSVAGPVAEMAEAMEQVEAGDLSVRVPVTDNDELGMLAQRFNQMTTGLQERDRIKDTFGRFVSPAIAQTILEDPPPKGGETTTVSVLFSDIRNYTTICERMEPAQVIELLNNYFEYMVAAVEDNNGLVYQFVGDGIMAVFGAPVHQADHCQRAFDAAVAMHEALGRFNQKHRAGMDPLRIGAGVASGPVVAGLLGSAQRVEYRVVGDTVNLAARVESLNKDLGTVLLIDQRTKDGLSGAARLKNMGSHQVKGRQQAVTVYTTFENPGPA